MMSQSLAELLPLSFGSYYQWADFGFDFYAGDTTVGALYVVS
jgi:sucrose-6-phosphate hydrolase SacC (GH32 family)